MVCNIHEKIEGLENLEISAAIKIRRNQVGEKVFDMSNPELDIVTKMSIGDIPNVQDGVLDIQPDRFKLEIEHIIVSDGLSLRRLDLGDLRNSFTVKGLGKVSVKNTKNDIPKLAEEFTDLGLKASGLSVLQPTYKIIRRVLGNTRFLGNMSHTSPFGANLKRGKDLIGEFSSVTHKWNAYSPQGDESKFDSDISFFDGKPVIRSSSELSIGDLGGRKLVSRVNIPIFGLSRDHAEDTIFLSESIISVVDYFGRRLQVASSQSEINMGPGKYHTIIQGT